MFYNVLKSIININMNYNNKIFKGLTMIRKYKGYTIIKENMPNNEIDLFGGIYLVKEKDINFYTLRDSKKFIDRIVNK